jgi:hypothetical protein
MRRAGELLEEKLANPAVHRLATFDGVQCADGNSQCIGRLLLPESVAGAPIF